MTEQPCILGLDTSNYTTSAALVTAGGEVVADARKLLSVKKGERGLRQSEALFQHVKNLPELFEEISRDNTYRIEGICASEKPRPAEGSYMPCFLAGSSFGKSIAELLKVPYYSTTHQEGHIEALLPGSRFSRSRGFLCFHVSGGTCELLEVTGEDIRIIGGSRDISFGQLIDRIGVSLGLDFPAGREMDHMAFGRKPAGLLKTVKEKDCLINLSGAETAAKKLMAEGISKEELAGELFRFIGDAIIKVCRSGIRSTGVKDIMLVGGVSTSRTIKQLLTENADFPVWISNGDRGRDNAVGAAMIGRNKLWE
ncbi:MAG: O-sialoglycoprotein endopeptidase [Eubacteriaceae bacterium]|nr:O-sialoglycoprotein endopeptidase [Eubacteriaceae bacterium]